MFRRFVAATSLALLIAAPTAALAQGDGEAPDATPTPTAATGEATVTATAFWATPAGEALPDFFFSGEVPPGTFCALQPDACPEQLTPLTGPVGEQSAELQNQTPPFEITAPDTLPVSVAAGEMRYQSGMQFTFADPGDQQIDSFVVRVPQANPTYHMSSPAFRQAVLAVMDTIGTRQPSQGEFEKLPTSEMASSLPIGVEACPFAAPFEPSDDAQPAETIPEVNCLFGANGVYVEDAEGNAAWEFDLTFAAKAWADGTLANNGIILRPSGVDNLAYGDPDLTRFAQVSFAQVESVPVAQETSDTPAPAPTLGPGPDGSPPGTEPGQAAVESGSPVRTTPRPVFGAPPAVSSNTSSSTSNPALTAESAPAVADTVGLDPVPAAFSDGFDDLPQDKGDITDLWWLMLAVIIGGGVTTQRALASSIDPSVGRTGALTHLLEKSTV